MDTVQQIGRQSIRVRIEGKASDLPPVLMLNGIGANLETWGEFAQQLTQTRQLIMLDMPGTGKSPARLYPVTMQAIANEVIALLDTLNVQQVDMVSYSWGGALAQQITEIFPDRVNNLVLVSTTPGLCGKLPEPTVIAMAISPIRYYSRTFAKFIAPFIHGDTSGEDALLDNLIIPNPIGFSHQLYAIANWSASRRVQNDTHRTLIISGDKDPLTPALNAEKLNEIYRQSTLKIVPGGHLWLLSEPEEATELINDWLLN